MKVVLDTNVLVSGLLTPFGTCGEIVRMLTSGELVLCVDARILLEYDDVLRRSKFSIDARSVDVLREYIQTSSERHACVPLATPLPDPDDSQFLEVALAAAADCLVTGNSKHFPQRCRGRVSVLSPATVHRKDQRAQNQRLNGTASPPVRRTVRGTHDTRQIEVIVHRYPGGLRPPCADRFSVRDPCGRGAVSRRGQVSGRRHSIPGRTAEGGDETWTGD
jgi:putative PIN family toxin of toxin-antitoxin system